MARTRAAHRLPSPLRTRLSRSSKHAARTTPQSAAPVRPSGPALLLTVFGVAALCTSGVGFGMHAALGDGDGPAVQLANRGVDLRPESGGEDGASAGGGAAAQEQAGGLPGSPPDARDSGPSPRSAPRPTSPPGASSPPAAPPSSAPPTAGNPYLDPSDPQYVPESERTAWLEGQQRIRACMNAVGHEYLEWRWWEGGNPKPAGLDESAATVWEFALQGDEGSAGCAVEAGDAPVPPDGAVPDDVAPPERSAPPAESDAPPSAAPGGMGSPEASVA